MLIMKSDIEILLRGIEEIIPKEEFLGTSGFFEKPIFDREYYERLSNKFRTPHLWQWDSEKGWELRHKIFENETKNSQEQTAGSWQGNK